MPSASSRLRRACVRLLRVAAATAWQAQAAGQAPGASNQAPLEGGGLSAPNDNPFPSTYRVPASKPFANQRDNITAVSPVIQKGTYRRP